MKQKEYAKVYKIRGYKRNKLKIKLFKNFENPSKVEFYNNLLNQEVYNSTKKVISRKSKHQLYIDVD